MNAEDTEAKNLHDEFAMAALQGMLAQMSEFDRSFLVENEIAIEVIALASWKMADAMMATRKRRQANAKHPDDVDGASEQR